MPSGGLKRLQREHYIGPELELESVDVVAEYIDATPTETYCCCDCDRDSECDDNCGCAEKVVIFKVTANVGGQTKTQEYEVKPRVGT
jgi:hypothetical protein